MRRELSIRRKIIIGLTIVLFLMATGYAAFSSRLTINGTSNISSNWQIEITNINALNNNTNGESVKAEIGNDKLTANIEADLYEVGDYVEYEVTVENKGTLDAVLNDTTPLLPQEANGIKISISGYTKGQLLYKHGQQGSSQTIRIRIECTSNQQVGSYETSITLNYVQATRKNQSGETETPYLVEYDCTTNGGDACTYYNEYKYEGEILTLPENTSTNNKGYNFVGWNTNSNATTGLDTIEIEENTTLYAIFSKAINVTYTKDEHTTNIGKENDICRIYNNNTTCEIILPSITPNSGYKILGWYNNNQNVGKPNNNYIVGEDITLIGKSEKSAPTCQPTVVSATIDTVTIDANCTSDGTISGYQYSINEGTPVNSTEDTYTFSSFDLSTIRVTATDEYDTKTFSISEDNLEAGYEIIYQKLNEEYESVNTAKTTYESQFLNKTYPIGSIYVTTNSTNPSSTLGGTWVAYAQGRTLVGMGSNGTTNYTTVEATGGSETVTLAVTNLPAHSHTVTPTGSVTSTFKGTQGTLPTAGGHSHTFDVSENWREASGYGLEGHSGYKDRVKVGGTPNDTTTTDGAHTHSYTAKGSVSSSFSGTSTTSSESGTSTAFNIMNPYIVTYIWKRTA